MEYAYRADAWQALSTAVAGVTAALTGLLFIALSLDLPTVIKVPAYRARAREALSGLLFLLWSINNAWLLVVQVAEAES